MHTTVSINLCRMESYLDPSTQAGSNEKTFLLAVPQEIDNLQFVIDVPLHTAAILRQSPSPTAFVLNPFDLSPKQNKNQFDDIIY